jgi:SAM-dependent methyltransferase
MKEPLSYFVKYKSLVDNIDLNPTTKYLTDEIATIMGVLDKSDFELDHKEKLLKQRDILINNLNRFEGLIDEFKDHATEFLRKEESSYLSLSYKNYKISKEQNTPEYILDQDLFHTLIYKDEIKNYFIDRLHYLSSWKYPGMFIRPENGRSIDEMTSSDPLYVADDHEHLLFPTKQMWNDDYQNRIRYHVIDDTKDIIFKQFPKKQFGLIVVMNYLNHKPLELIKRYLMELYGLLRPGGTLLFTYNNCNIPLAVQNFEKMCGSYTPGSLVEPMVEFIGFEIFESYNEPLTNVSWLELKKPGELTSLRGGQCLAEINEKG